MLSQKVLRGSLSQVSSWKTFGHFDTLKKDIPHYPIESDTAVRLLAKKLTNQVLTSLGHLYVRWKGKFCLLNRISKFKFRRYRKGHLPIDHLEKGNTKSPNVDFLWVALWVDLVWCHVGQSAAEAICSAILWIQLAGAGEVTEPNLHIQCKVPRCQCHVSMHNFLRSQIQTSFDHLH